MSNSLIGQRLRMLRDERGLSQADIAALLELNDRQTVQAIESGARSLKAPELVALVQELQLPIDYFTDPFRLRHKAAFCWRKSGEAADARLGDFQEKAKAWLGAYRALAERSGDLPVTLPTLGLGERSSLEEAEAAAERLAAKHFGDSVPAARLARVIEDDLDTLVLMVDADPSISGAACHTVGLNAALVNRHEVEGRRNFDLAHELFHVLTWQELPPAYIDGQGTKKQARTEKLADKFAITLLTPAFKLAKYRTSQVATVDWLNRTADEFGVTSLALMYRVLNLGWITKPQADGIDRSLLVNNGRRTPRTESVLPFGRRFLSAFSEGIGEGRISVRKAAAILGVTVDGLGRLLEGHGLEKNFDL